MIEKTRKTTFRIDTSAAFMRMARLKADVSIYPSLEKEFPGIDELEVDGEHLYKALDFLDKWAKKNDLTPLMEMVSSPPDKIAEIFEVDVKDLPEHFAIEEWFPTSEGLRTVHRMVKYLQETPAVIQDSDKVLTDLKDIETALVAAENAEVRFHFSIEF